MRVKYVGDPNDNGSGPETVTRGGVEFTKGKATNLPRDFPEAEANKLRGNSHFEVSGEKREASVNDAETVELPSTTGDPETANTEALRNIPELRDAPAPQPQTAQRIADGSAFDHDDDGKAGGSRKRK